MLYVGVMNNLEKRVLEHKSKLTSGFTQRYNLFKLGYFELFGDIRDAILREKQIKGWLRAKKLALIEAVNPQWNDLARDHARSGARFKNRGKPKDRAQSWDEGSQLQLNLDRLF
jgi:putative endonuclease